MKAKIQTLEAVKEDKPVAIEDPKLSPSSAKLLALSVPKFQKAPSRNTSRVLKNPRSPTSATDDKIKLQPANSNSLKELKPGKLSFTNNSVSVSTKVISLDGEVRDLTRSPKLRVN